MVAIGKRSFPTLCHRFCDNIAPLLHGSFLETANVAADVTTGHDGYAEGGQCLLLRGKGAIISFLCTALRMEKRRYNDPLFFYALSLYVIAMPVYHQPNSLAILLAHPPAS